MMPIWLVLAGCEPTTPSADAASATGTPVATARVELASYRPTAEISGSAEPIRSVRLGFEVGGRLEELLVKRGDVVLEGQELAVLDARVAGSQYQQATAGLAAAQAALAAAEDNLARLKQLGENVSAQQLTQVDAQVKAAIAQRDQARAAQQVAGVAYRSHTLQAPIGGIVTEAPDNPGTLIAPGTPLFVIEDLSALRIKGTAPESDEWLVTGLQASVRSGTGAEEALAVVERVIPSLDPATRRLPVEVRIDSPPPWLRAHAFVRARVTAAQDVTAFSVPKGAIVARPDFAVLVVPGPTSDPTDARRVPVTVVREDTERTLVIGDLGEGDLVAIAPPQDFSARAGEQ
jgi:RND family efflux transporter MFP subunit